jgi:hypothetical protein
LETDALRVSALITGVALCTDCIAAKTGLAVTRVDEVLVHIRNLFVVTSVVARCDDYLRETVVHRLG